MKLLVCTQAVDKDDPILGFFHGWLFEFARHCESLEVICLREGKHDLPENVHVHTLGKTHRGESLFIDSVRYGFRFLFLALRLMRRYDQVFVHMNPEYVLLGALFWKISKKPVALWYTHKSVTLKLRIATLLICYVFTASAESFRIKSKKVVVTGHGIDTDRFDAPRTPHKEGLRIITVGRLSRSKNILCLIRAMAELPRLGVTYRCAIVGDAITKDDEKYRDEIQWKIQEMDIGRWVTLEGEKSNADIPPLLAEADIFLHAGDTGSLDKAMLEAMSERCVVISSNDAARPILEKIDWRLVAKPDPTSFATAIQRVYELTENERSHIGESLRAVVVADHSLRRLTTRIVWTLSQNK